MGVVVLMIPPVNVCAAVKLCARFNSGIVPVLAGSVAVNAEAALAGVKLTLPVAVLEAILTIPVVVPGTPKVVVAELNELAAVNTLTSPKAAVQPTFDSNT